MFDDDESAETTTGQAAGMSDDELIAVTDEHIRQSIAYMGGKLSEQRRRNEYFYLAQPVGELAAPSIDGRSSIVSTDVADTVEWMLPSLVKTFTAGDTVCEFSPRRQQDEEAATQATDYANYVLFKQNPGFSLIYTWIKDALIQKAGVMKVWWDTSKEDVRETYRGLSDQELQMLLMSPDVEPIEHTARPDQAAQEVAENFAAMGLQAPPPPMVHDVVVKREKACGRVRIENVPPEEFLISRSAKTIADAAFVGHRVEKTISDLRAMGYQNVDDIGGDGTDNAGAMSAERIERRSFDDEMPYMFGEAQAQADESQRMVWVTECYIRLDYNGDGIAELRKVVRCGGVILANEECDGRPFVAITPIPLPHRFFGLCPADMAVEPQKLKTSILRAGLDGLYHSINGRTFAVDGQVNLDDLLTSRPGGVVRVKQNGAVGPLMEGKADLGAAQAMLEYAEVMKENRTGFTRYSQGTSADSLNQTATGVNLITNRADSRIELIARVFAETGFQDLFKRILQLVSQYQDQATVARVNGKWVNFDPRAWATQFDFTVNVGLGTGNKDQQVQHLMMLGQVMQQGAQIGMCTPREFYNAAKKLTESLGFKQPELFFQDPTQAQPQPPKPDPAMAKVQADMQSKQAELQMKQQAQAAQLQADVARFQLEREKAMADIQLARERLEAEIALKREQFAATMSADQEAKLYARLQAEAEAEVEDVEPEGPDLRAMVQQLLEAHTAPKRKTMSIQGPSGAVYQGEIVHDGIGPKRMTIAGPNGSTFSGVIQDGEPTQQPGATPDGAMQ